MNTIKEYTKSTVAVNHSPQTNPKPKKANADYEAIHKALQESFADLPVQVDPSGLTLTGAPSDAEAELIFKRLKALHYKTNVWLNFALGDFYNALSDGYGVRKRAAQSMAGEDYGSFYKKLRNCGWVARRWTKAARGVEWSWTYYKASASLSETRKQQYVRRYQAGEKNLIPLIEREAAEKRQNSNNVSGGDIVAGRIVSASNNTLKEAETMFDDLDEGTLPELVRYSDISVTPDLQLCIDFYDDNEALRRVPLARKHTHFATPEVPD